MVATCQSCSFHSHLTSGDKTDNNIISSASVAYKYSSSIYMKFSIIIYIFLYKDIMNNQQKIK